MTPRPVAFVDHGATQQSGNDGGPRLVVAADGRGRAELASLLADARPQAGRIYVGVFAGSQRTGGFTVHVDSIERAGDRLNIRSTFASPAPGALTIQVITSPAHLVSIASADAAGVRQAILLDQSGAEKARTAVPQSTP